MCQHSKHNIDYELELFAQTHSRRVRFTREARTRLLSFATSPAARWRRNFRDLNGVIRRLCTLSPSGRISETLVVEEIERLERLWSDTPEGSALEGLLDPSTLDLFDRLQLESIVAICRRSRSLSDAGRKLYAVSQQKRRSKNDADRLRKYLARFDLSWDLIVAEDGR